MFFILAVVFLHGVRYHVAVLLSRRQENNRDRDGHHKERIVGFLDMYAETFGQHMPNKATTYLYIESKAVRSGVAVIVCFHGAGRQLPPPSRKRAQTIHDCMRAQSEHTSCSRTHITNKQTNNHEDENADVTIYVVVYNR